MLHLVQRYYQLVLAAVDAVGVGTAADAANLGLEDVKCLITGGENVEDLAVQGVVTVTGSVAGELRPIVKETTGGARAAYRSVTSGRFVETSSGDIIRSLQIGIQSALSIIF